MSTLSKRQRCPRPFRLQLTGPKSEVRAAEAALTQALAATGLDEWFERVSPTIGPWGLWWDETAIWTGAEPDPAAWQAALLEGWWGAGGGCC